MRLDLEIQRRVTKHNRQIKIRVVDKGENMRREWKQGRLLDCCWWWILQTLDSRTGTPTTWTRFDFFAYSHKNLHCTFSPEELALLFLLKEVKPSFDHKMIKLLTFDNLFLPLPQFAKTRSRMATTIALSRQNLLVQLYWENLGSRSRPRLWI